MASEVISEHLIILNIFLGGIPHTPSKYSASTASDTISIYKVELTNWQIEDLTIHYHTSNFLAQKKGVYHSCNLLTIDANFETNVNTA